jgi:hypothetical protein
LAIAANGMANAMTKIFRPDLKSRVISFKSPIGVHAFSQYLKFARGFAS